MKVDLRFGLLLRSVLTKVKDPLPLEKRSKVVYWILCSYGKSYIDETRTRLETRLREHQEACRKRTLEKSAYSSGACMERSPHHQVGGNHSGWHDQTPQWAVGRGSHAHQFTWPLLKNVSTEIRNLSSLDAGWLPWEDRKAGPTRQVQHLLMGLPQTPVTTNDAVYNHITRIKCSC